VYYAQENQRWVAAVNDSPKPPSQRITFTFPILLNARCVIFVACGASKAEIVKVSVLLLAACVRCIYMLGCFSYLKILKFTIACVCHNLCCCFHGPLENIVEPLAQFLGHIVVIPVYCYIWKSMIGLSVYVLVTFVWWPTSANLCTKTGHTTPTPQTRHTTFLVWCHTTKEVVSYGVGVVCPVFVQRLALVGHRTFLSPVKIAEPTEMQFGGWLAWAHGTIIRWGQDLPWERAILRVMWHIQKHWQSLLQSSLHEWPFNHQ